MAGLFLLALFLLGANCQHHHQDPTVIYKQVIKDVWMSSDTNGDGDFEPFELTGVFAHYDEDGDHIVTHHEYVDLIDKHDPLHNYVKALFTEYDANDDKQLDDDDKKILYSKMDTDGSGLVSEAEFSAFWMEILQKYAHLHGHGMHLAHH